VVGAAWGGEADVTEVAVSPDGGRAWAAADFLDPACRYAWRRWTFNWITTKHPGRSTLLSRARAADGDRAAGRARRALRQLRDHTPPAD